MSLNAVFNMPSNFKKFYKVCCFLGIGRYLCFAAVLMQRFTDAQSGTPAPGAYNDPREALETLKKISGMKRSPFGKTEIRFKPMHGTETPGV